MFQHRKILFVAAALFGVATLTASSQAAPVTFELNNGNALFTAAIAGAPSSATFSGGVGTDLNITLTGTSNSSSLGLKRGGGGSSDGVGVDSTGTGLGGDNGTQIDFQNANGTQVFAEGIDFSFTDDLTNPVSVNVISVTVAELSTGEEVDVSIGGTPFTISGGATDDFLFAFPGNTQLNAGAIASFDAGNADTAFRVHAITVEVIPEPGTLALAGLGGLLMLARRRQA